MDLFRHKKLKYWKTITNCEASQPEERPEEVRGGSLVTPVFISGSVILQVVLSAFKLLLKKYAFE